MAITLRHDASAVVPPSNNATRKYGQSLVMQQNQQKYAAQQAGYDRMFDAYKMENQNQVQQQRDWQQRDFVLNRDRDQNKFQQQQMEAARQQQFMDEARKQQSGMIMDDIKNGEYDPGTARKLQQNLAAESEALGNPQLDATQRAEALQKIRAERALLAANRMQKPPPPTREEQLREFLGPNYDNYADQPWVPDGKGGFVIAKDAQQQKQQKLEQEQEQKRFTSADDAFRADPKLEARYMDEAIQIQTKGGEVPLTMESRKVARAQARQLYEEDNGLGYPTTAPADPGAATPADPSGEMKSILEQPAPAQPDMSQMENPLPSQYAPPSAPPGTLTPATPPAVKDWTGGDGLPQRPAPPGYQWVTPTDGSKPFLYHPGPNNTPIDKPLTSPGQPVPAAPAAPTPGAPYMPKEVYDQMVASQGTGRQPYDVPQRDPAQNAWAQVATPPATPTDKTTTARKKTPQAGAQPAAPKTPDFGALASGATSAVDKTFINNMQKAYQGQSPDVQSAMSVLLDSNASDRDAANAMMYLQQKGIDVEKMMQAPSTSPRMSPSPQKRTGTSRPNSPR